MYKLYHQRCRYRVSPSSFSSYDVIMAPQTLFDKKLKKKSMKRGECSSRALRRLLQFHACRDFRTRTKGAEKKKSHRHFSTKSTRLKRVRLNTIHFILHSQYPHSVSTWKRNGEKKRKLSYNLRSAKSPPPLPPHTPSPLNDAKMRKSFVAEKFAIQMHLSVTVFKSNVEPTLWVEGDVPGVLTLDEGGFVRVIYVGQTVL